MITMRITRRQLRELIKEMAWDPKSSPYAHPGYMYGDLGATPRSVRRTKDYQDYLDDEAKRHELRAQGLLSAETAEKEKQILRDYHEANKKEIEKFYNELKKSPDSARITCLHSTAYEGGFTKKDTKSLTQWVSRFGKKGKDQLSTVMFPCNVTDLYNYFIPGRFLGQGNAEQIMLSPSFIMSGYPTLMNYDDMMTQTLSNLHPDLVKFQSSSGVSKSSGEIPDINNFEQFLKDKIISEETVLDNWEVKGAHFSKDPDVSWLRPDYREDYLQRLEEQVETVINQCVKLGIPLWITDVVNSRTSRVV